MFVFLFMFLVFYLVLLYFSIFRLSKEDVEVRLPPSTICSTIQECNLMPGDILIRRYITEDTRLFDQIVQPFFTHSSVYIGSGQIVSAVGFKPNIQDEVIQENLYTSDWMHLDMEKWFIVRPLFTQPYIKKIIKNLEDIANDPQYGFGLFDASKKQTTCADIIYRQLTVDPSMSTLPESPKHVTPDYLFWLSTEFPQLFQIMGHN